MNALNQRIEQLERELHLKHLQTNALLNITQAINDNLSNSDLYQMYRSILNWEMGVRCMVLFVKTDAEKWVCTTQIGLSDIDIRSDEVIPHLIPYERNHVIAFAEGLLSRFSFVIPIIHDHQRIAYALLGEFDEGDEQYHKLQFITTITNIIAVALENKRLLKEQYKQERLKQDMKLAQQMQHMMVPHKMPKTPHYELASIYQPHYSVGGDYFDYFEHDGVLSLCVADIAGKGTPAALLMANFQALFNTIILRTPNLEVLVRELNEAVLRLTRGERHLTMFVAQYNTHTRELTYVCAGHQPPILVRRTQTENLDKGTTLIGFFDELPQVQIGKVCLQEEALLLVFTDGLTDIKNEEGAFLNQEMLEVFAQEHAHLNSEQFNEKLFAFLNRFKKEGAYPDDLTVLICKFLNVQVPILT